MTLREEFEKEMKEKSRSMLDFFFLTSGANYVNWLEARQNKRTEEQWNNLHEAFVTSMKIDKNKSTYEHLQEAFQWFKKQDI